MASSRTKHCSLGPCALCCRSLPSLMSLCFLGAEDRSMVLSKSLGTVLKPSGRALLSNVNKMMHAGGTQYFVPQARQTQNSRSERQEWLELRRINNRRKHRATKKTCETSVCPGGNEIIWAAPFSFPYQWKVESSCDKQ